MPQDIETLKFVIIIPAFNEEKFIGSCLKSLTNQTYIPNRIIVVDDSSTDNTPTIIKQFAEKYTIIKYIHNSSTSRHQPGTKVVNAFKRGLGEVSLSDFDIICKFDADLEFPLKYLESIHMAFLNNPEIGLIGGVCSILKDDKWEIESLTNLDHVRGALKAYRKTAFIDISGLQSQMGWDTADEFKLRYRNWQVWVNKDLRVKHYKPTTKSYKNEFYKKQAEVFYALDYGLALTIIASLKTAFQRRQPLKFFLILKAYNKAKMDDVQKLLKKEEGQFLRHYRWKEIIRKLIP